VYSMPMRGVSLSRSPSSLSLNKRLKSTRNLPATLALNPAAPLTMLKERVWTSRLGKLLPLAAVKELKTTWGSR